MKNIYIKHLIPWIFLTFPYFSVFAEDQQASSDSADNEHYFRYLDEYGTEKVYSYDNTKPEYRGAQKVQDLPFDHEEIERLGKKNGKYLWFRSAVSVPMKDANGADLVATAEYLLYLGTNTNVLILPDGNKVWGRVACGMKMNYLPGMIKFPIIGCPGMYVHKIPPENMKVFPWNFSYFNK